MNLSDRLLTNKGKVSKTVVYDKDWGISFDLVFMSRPDMQSLIRKHTKIEFNPKTHQKEENVDNDKLTENIMKDCVLGWKGITYKWLASKLPFDMTGLKEDDELNFSLENLKTLCEQVIGIDSWIIDSIRDGGSFSEKKEIETKN